MPEKAEFPLLVRLFDQKGILDDAAVVKSADVAEPELEFFDSKRENAIVTDAKGRRVHLVVEACTVKVYDLIE